MECVVLPQKLITLERETFRNCYSLRKIDLPKSLRTIRAGTFESCGFNQLVIPKSVKSIGKNALQVTTKKMIFKGKNVPKIAKQDACQYGKYVGNTDPDFDLRVVRLDDIDIQYPMQHGIGKVKVPTESTGKYKKALKEKMEYRELEY
ncbi:MAG: leucine-rich repeat domain-containing protein [Roseburia sp.]|nr:leucine-rich repeat domain-containing protein [Roseburia sp.]